MFHRLSLVATKSYSRIPRPVIQNHFMRFEACYSSRPEKPVISVRKGAAHKPFCNACQDPVDCDWGYNCGHDGRGGSWRPIYDRCKANPTAKHWSEIVWGLGERYLCDDCWRKYTKEFEKKEAAMFRLINIRDQRRKTMMAKVRAIRSTEQVPLSYAIDRAFGSSRRSQQEKEQTLLRLLRKDLQIVKVRNEYMCKKERVDAIDFGVFWHFKKFWK